MSYFDDPVETVEHAGFRIDVYPDEHSYALNPREEQDNLGPMWFKPLRDVIQPDGKKQDPGISWEQMQTIPGYDHWADEDDHIAYYLKAHRKLGNVVIPLEYNYYGANGSTIHRCDDEDADGFVYLTRDKIAENWPSWKRLTKDRRAQLEEWLMIEVKTYENWCNGEVYHYTITDPKTEEVVGGCSGYYGIDVERGGRNRGKEPYIYLAAKEEAEGLRAEIDRKRSEALANHAEIEEATEGFWGSGLSSPGGVPLFL